MVPVVICLMCCRLERRCHALMVYSVVMYCVYSDEQILLLEVNTCSKMLLLCFYWWLESECIALHFGTQISGGWNLNV